MPEEKTGAVEDIMKQAEQDIDKETVTPTGELSQEEKEDQELAEKDEEYKEAVDEIKQQKNIHPRFREVYKKMKEAERRQEELQSQLDEIAQKEPEEPDETTLQQLAARKGFKLTKEEKREVAKLQNLIDKAETPEERNWWRQYSDALIEEMNGNFSKQHGELFKSLSKGGELYEEIVEMRHDRQEKQAKAYIDEINKKHKTSIDYDKDIDSEIADIIRQSRGRINRYNVNIYALTREVLADKGIELGKKMSQREQKKSTEEKRQANIETPGVTSSPAKDYSKMTTEQLIAETMKEEGL